MVTNKRRKNSRHRGSHTHGWGAMKKHRGHGNKGGRGNAGSGKRGDAKKPSNWHDVYFGKFGFKKKGQKDYIIPINLVQLDLDINKFVENKLATNNSGTYELKLEDCGYNKLLSSGKVKNKYNISTPYASKKAIEKIKEAGGQVTITKKEIRPKKSEK
jgi:large subunit ribosomal protein L15